MMTEFEYGGYAVVVRAIPHASGGYAGMVQIADAFGEPFGPTFETEAGSAPTPEAALALAEASAMQTIDAGEVN
ncbi:hypothetical protein [Cupriavidus plantarum]|uniref:Uncharacterized protein n=1 Tax=Cupriavidus plantarum TaxID=942865 RepID=A0A316F0A7_9BURK|nr:hypothetical protein [Cupriavidus plantarum]NYH98434.1 hypothetical protein [Cupriavidus plantarum]PWK37936.1 hypothetical protein C7419_1011823 [Cupriavidus plantarum]REF01365.1 hypothetical protein C7418_0142 [Cupriavidus plantarum]RLK45776.1 hypothetical protein C7417_1800 [Cupriavidus plantarum]CAG2127871.1 hypothetical protein LMG26296_00915 [Cupriavidus plantarum]